MLYLIQIQSKYHSTTICSIFIDINIIYYEKHQS